jgi:tRNA threonylcarbamoyladenosine biosynthesis protein TsaB
MSLILQIETATTVCSVALAMEGKIIALKELNEPNIHAQKITLFIQEVLQNAGSTFDAVDAVAVSSGPGSYTGLRIGVSTAKGLCFALNKPLIAVETLAAMSSGFAANFNPGENVLLCPMIDARRMEVYTSLFDVSGNTIEPTSAKIIDATSFADFLKDHRIIFFGDGADKCREALGTNHNAMFNSDFSNSAAYLTALAANKFKANDFEDVAYFEPYYLKDFIAGKKIK